MKTTANKFKKKYIIAGFALLVIVCLVFVLLYLLGGNSERDSRFYDDSLSFAEADYDRDILSDPFYLRYDRDVQYSEYGYSEPLTDENYTTFGSWAEFFYRYFDTVIRGDYNAYPAYFTDAYIKSHDLPERFTMQRLYDINVTLYSRDSIEYNGKQAPCSRYIVSYRIQYNNGTFRGDFTGNDVRPLLFSLVDDGGTVKIFSITQINYKESE